MTCHIYDAATGNQWITFFFFIVSFLMPCGVKAFAVFGIQWVMSRSVNSFFFIWRNWFGKRLSTIWNMVLACLMWLVWQEHNARIFEDKERTLDHLKSLIFGALFQWARIWGCTNCISLSEFLVSIFFSSWLYCICFLFIVFTIVNLMFNFFQ